MKHCRDCNETKELADYYMTAKGAPMHICKACHKEAMRRNRLKNPEVQERERKRAKLPHRRATARRVAVLWREENPEAYKAQTKVGNAIRDGKLKRCPCTICGTTKHVHAHHKDYSKPLDVTWLCARCHHRLHSAFPELGGHAEKSA